MPQAHATASRHSSGAGKASENGAKTAQIVFNGIVKLLKGQRRFCEEMGLSYDRVFDQECLVFRSERPESVLLAWLRDRVEGPEKLSLLINDLVEHNLALFAAIDGVARESISRLGPSSVKSKSFSLFGWRPFAWLTYRRLHREFSTNDYLRHQELVVKGFAKAYCSHREALRSLKTCVCTPAPTNDKE